MISKSFNSFGELYDFAEQQTTLTSEMLSSFEDHIATPDQSNAGEEPGAFWRRLSTKEHLTPEVIEEMLQEMCAFNSQAILMLRSLTFFLSEISRIVTTLTDVTMTHERELEDVNARLNEIFYAIDMHERSLINMSNKTRSFAIIGGGKNHESNIPGCDEPDPKASGKGSESSETDSS